MYVKKNKGHGGAQAWYREGTALSEMGRWEEAAQTFYEGLRVDPEHAELAQAFNRAIQEGRKAHAAAEQRRAAS